MKLQWLIVSNLKQNAGMIAREEADKKAQKVKSYMKLVEYRVTDENDIMLITGTYSGRHVRALWLEGSDQRDYIIKQLYRRGDDNVVSILKELFCK